MSLLSAVEQAIKSCKAEQAKINESIDLYKGLLHSLTPQPKTSFDESQSADTAATDMSMSPGEKEDIELLEQALEKALRVRTCSGTSKRDPGGTNKQSGPQKERGTTVLTSMQDASKSSATTIRSTSKSAIHHGKGQKKTGSSVSSTTGSRSSASSNRGQSRATNSKSKTQNHRARKLQPAGSGSGTGDHISPLRPENKTIKSSVLRSADSAKATAIPTPASNNTLPFPHTDYSGAHSINQCNGVPSEQTTKWKSLRNKQNRLWDKVIAQQRSPVSGRSHFMERMRAMGWACGRPDETRALIDKPTHPGCDPSHPCQTKKRMAQSTPGVATEPELEAWDRWVPQGGCLSPSGSNSVWEDGPISILPLTVTYTAEAELQELEKLRMRVALLQQEIQLEQALRDALCPQLSSIAPGPGCPNPSVLRDIYSLLGEGGERYPTIVLDTEPD